MERPDPFLPDWRDAAAYAPLLAADRFILAWEWLRRIPDYALAAREAGLAAAGGSAQWGLHRFEDPALAAPSARPMWRAAAASPVLEALATNDPDGAAIDFARIAGFASLHAGEAGAPASSRSCGRRGKARLFAAIAASFGTISTISTAGRSGR